MGAQITSIEVEPWGESVLGGRALLGTHAQSPEMDAYGPMAPKPAKTQYPLVAALLVLMVVAVGAICCCCYQWEGQMRLQARPRSTGHSEMIEGTPRSSANSRHSSGDFCGTNPRVSSVSVIMPGDDIPRFIAWTVPQGAPAAAAAVPKALQPTPAEPDLHRGKFAYNSVVGLNSWIPGRVSG